MPKELIELATPSTEQPGKVRICYIVNDEGGYVADFATKELADDYLTQDKRIAELEATLTAISKLPCKGEEDCNYVPYGQRCASCQANDALHGYTET